MRMVPFTVMEAAPDLSFLNMAAAEKARNFHKTFPMYRETPLISRKENAKQWGIDELYVKDESFRFDLNAFKILGSSYAIGNYIAERLNIRMKDLTFDLMTSVKLRKELGDLTFVTATDGNHGRSLAWMSKLLRQKSVVYLPKGYSKERLSQIQAEGGLACITEHNYERCIRLASEQAEKNGWIAIQDIAREGYTRIPAWILQGYTTLAMETYEQIPKRPTHIFIQAGVGSLSASIAGFFASVYGQEKPIIVIVEPNAADCIYKSAEAGDGRKRIVEGNINTIMTGLACGEPCSISWDILKLYADYAISCSDEITKNGMRLLAKPLKKDKKIISGESGALGFGCVAELLSNPERKKLKKQLKLNSHSVVLTISTEGAADPKSYQSIIGEAGLSI